MTMVTSHKQPSRTVLLRGTDFPDKWENTYGWIRANITKGNRSQMSPKVSNTQPDRRDLPRVLRVTRPLCTRVVQWKFTGKPSVPMTKAVGIMTTHWAKCETDGKDKVVTDTQTNREWDTKHQVDSDKRQHSAVTLATSNKSGTGIERITWHADVSAHQQ